MTRLVVVGDVLLDRDIDGEVTRLAPDVPVPVLDERGARDRPGGAGLAAVLATADGATVSLVTALARDTSAERLLELLTHAGIEIVDLGSTAPTAEKTRLCADGRALLRWDRSSRAVPADIGPWSPAAQAAVDAADGMLVSCYGRGVTTSPSVRAALTAATRRMPVTWDPHPRGSEPVPGCAVATPNEAEAAIFARNDPRNARTNDQRTAQEPGLDVLTARAETLARRWRAAGVALTRGANGVLFSSGTGLPLVVPAPAVTPVDPCGAGDRFAAALAVGLAGGWIASAAVSTAVQAASRFVATGGAGALRLDPETPTAQAVPADAFEVADRVRSQGGSVVATGGCFDLLHAGHLQVLRMARSLGDCLIVCMNSDASVRRLKGDGRPIVTEADRTDLLLALDSVDAVVVFDEDTPAEVLRRLRPHVFAKGGDYGSTDIPETAVLATWGGQTVTLPYLQGRSTTRILEEVRAHAD